MKITSKNVKELWELYENYQHISCNTHNGKMIDLSFEDFVDSEVVVCENCGEYILKSDIGNSGLAANDCICVNCMGDGYGL